MGPLCCNVFLKKREKKASITVWASVLQCLRRKQKSWWHYSMGPLCCNVFLREKKRGGHYKLKSWEFNSPTSPARGWREFLRTRKLSPYSTIYQHVLGRIRTRYCSSRVGQCTGEQTPWAMLVRGDITVWVLYAVMSWKKIIIVQ